MAAQSFPPPAEPVGRRTGGGGVRFATNSVAVWALALGLLSVPSAINPVVGGLLALLALILGGIGLSRSGQMDGVGRGPAITGIVSALLGLLLVAGFIAGYAALDRFLNSAEGSRFQERAREYLSEVDARESEAGG